jgi:hypothetical protein
VIKKNGSEETSNHMDDRYAEVSAIWRKTSPKRMRAAKTSYVAVYKKDMRHTIRALEGIARASKREVPTRVPKTNKISSIIHVT